MTILLIRHGETPLNVRRVLQPPDTPLSERGLEQAQRLARHLEKFGVAGVVSSDLARAQQTALAVAQACASPLETSTLLRERNFGALRGRPYDGLGFDPLAMAKAPPGGESMWDFRQRVALAFAWVVQRRADLDGSLAVVTHGLVIRALFESLVGLPPGVATPARIGNTSLTLVSAHPPHVASLVDSTRHLVGGAADDPGSLVGG